jgi:hypothetical protein
VSRHPNPEPSKKKPEQKSKKTAFHLGWESSTECDFVRINHGHCAEDAIEMFVQNSKCFFTLDSFASRKELLKRIVAANGDSKDREMLDDIIAAANKANNQRREVAHALILLKHPTRLTDFALLRPKWAIKSS